VGGRPHPGPRHAGYTRGSVTYLMEIGGKRIAFTGDLLRDDGKLLDLFSLQDAIPGPASAATTAGPAASATS